MATNTNPEFLPVESPTTTGYKIVPLYGKDTSGNVTKMLWRGLGGPTATNGANTTSTLGHVMMAETYDDSWQNSTPASSIGSGAAVQICATPLANRKAITVSMTGTASGKIYFGPTSAVTDNILDANRGLEVQLSAAGYAAVSFPFGPRMTLWARCVAGTTVQLTASELA